MALTVTHEGFWPNTIATAPEAASVSAEHRALRVVKHDRDGVEHDGDGAEHETDGAELASSELAADLDDQALVDFADFVDFVDFGNHGDLASHAADSVPGTVTHSPDTFGGENLTAIRAQNPRMLAAYRELESAVMSGSPGLTECDRVLVGLVVAIELGSEYWTTHLARRLAEWVDQDGATQLLTNWTAADLDIRDRAILAFATKLALVPSEMNERDAEVLVDVGLDDESIIGLVDVVAYWSYAARVSDGLGLYLEPS